MVGWGSRLVLLLAAGTAIGASHAQLPAEPRTNRGEGYLPDATTAKLFSAGFDALLADAYWLQAVQLGGGRGGPVGQSHRIGALVDLVTDLNPRVDHPYRFAALWMTDDLAAVRKANELLERGIEAHPGEWRNRFYLAFNHFFYLGENERAADILAGAVHLEDAPRYLGSLAARLRSDREGLAAAAAFVATLLRGTDEADTRTRQIYEWTLKEIETERRARLLDRARAAFRERHGRDIERVEELASGSAPVLRALPAEPFGEGWALDAAGVIVSARLGHRYEPQIDLTNRQRVEAMKARGEDSNRE